MGITLAQAKRLRPGQILYAIGQYNADGTVQWLEYGTEVIVKSSGGTIRNFTTR